MGFVENGEKDRYQSCATHRLCDGLQQIYISTIVLLSQSPNFDKSPQIEKSGKFFGSENILLAILNP